ncbi:hypothetical protein PSEUDO8AS_40467 [Pseudomonas sp. 8AS]|nr:hypothetical protein PSEUDO8AS_40467 [Pseudomonas sp. 8AS]
MQTMELHTTRYWDIANKKPALGPVFCCCVVPGQKLSRFGQRHSRESLKGSTPTGSGHRSEPLKKAG